MWQHYEDIIVESFSGYARYLLHDIAHPSWHSFFYGLIAVSALVYALELIFPWRKDQPRIRRDFWIDAFYVFFNVFLFSLIGYNALSNVAVDAFSSFRGALGLSSLVALSVERWPVAGQLAAMFVIRDFIQYWIHRLLHRVSWLWQFHKVHHSVIQMGFAAQLRFHPMETIVYRTLEYIPLAMIGFGIEQFFVVNMLALTIGTFNHANLRLPIGPLRYIVNSPQMHLWHHAKDIPDKYGVNYGLSLSVWDWVFGTVHWPRDDKDLPLGFARVESYPTSFAGHLVEPFRGRRERALARAWRRRLG